MCVQGTASLLLKMDEYPFAVIDTSTVMDSPLIAVFESFIGQLRIVSRHSVNCNRAVVVHIIRDSILQYPQSYISKLWRNGYHRGIFEMILELQEHKIPYEGAFLAVRVVSKDMLNIDGSFNRDTVSERHFRDLKFLLGRLEQDH
jgi:hypothetical protein